MPRLNPRTAEIIAGVLVVTVLGCIFFLGLPQLLSVEARLGAILLNLAFALWAMLVLHFALQTQANARRGLQYENRLAGLEKKLSGFETPVADQLAAVSASLLKAMEQYDQTQSARVSGAREDFSASLSSLRGIVGANTEELKNNAAFRSQVLDELVKILGKPRLDVNKRGKIVGSPKPRYSNIEDISEVIVEMRKDVRDFGISLTPSQGDDE